MIEKVLNKKQVFDYDLRADLAQELRMFVLDMARHLIEYEKSATIHNREGYIYQSLLHTLINLQKSVKYRKHFSLNQMLHNHVNLDFLTNLPSHVEETTDDVILWIEKETTKEEFFLLVEYYLKGKTYEEIGRQLQISKDTARRRVNQIIKRLRERW